MRPMIDGSLHIADVPALVAFFAAHEPDKLDEDGKSITGFVRTPTVIKGASLIPPLMPPCGELRRRQASAPGGR